jgi:hypothetical protein
MTLKAMIGQDRPHVAVEFDRSPQLRASGGTNANKKSRWHQCKNDS